MTSNSTCYWSNPQLDVLQATCWTGSELSSHILGHARPSLIPHLNVGQFPAYSHTIERQRFPSHSLPALLSYPDFQTSQQPLLPCPATFQTWDGLPSLCAFPSAGNSHPTESAGASSTTTETPSSSQSLLTGLSYLLPIFPHVCLTSCAGSTVGSLFHFGISTQKVSGNP